MRPLHTLFLVCGLAAGAGAQTFTAIAKTGELAPGGGLFESFLGAAAQRGGQVVFVATDSSAPGDPVIWRSNGGVLTPVAAADWTVPDGQPGEVFVSFNVSAGASPTIDESGNVAFVGFGDQGTVGVYADLGAGLIRVYDSLQPDNYDGFGSSSISDGRVGFNAQDNDPFYVAAMTAADPLSTDLVASTLTSIPSGSGDFDTITIVAHDQGEVAFVGFGPSNQHGIYKDVGILQRVADRSTEVPGTPGVNFGAMSNPTIRDGNAAFISTSGAFPNTNGGIYTDRTGVLERVADKLTAVPDGVGNFLAFGGPSLDGDTIAFMGIDGASSYGLYTDACGGVLTEIFDSNDVLDGKTSAFVSIGTHALDASKLVFTTIFADFSYGIYVANLADFDAYGSGLSGSGGFVPAMAGIGTPAPGELVSLSVIDGLGGASGSLFIGVEAVALPFKGGALLTLPVLAIAHDLGGAPGVPGAGTWTLPFIVPTGVSGVDIYFQALYLDQSPFAGVTLTNGLRMCVP